MLIRSSLRHLLQQRGLTAHPAGYRFGCGAVRGRMADQQFSRGLLCQYLAAPTGLGHARYSS